MTRLTFTDYIMSAAEMGAENPNPDFGNVEYIHAGYTCSDKITGEEKKYIGKGMINTILPYTILDNYGREKKERPFKAAVIENNFLKAVFLPELGGRLWSLFDKRLNRELLYVNPVFQPANLAIRNAWFSGGIEWNVGIKGHTPLTCDPLFSEYAEGENGEPVLRMYEYERKRRIVYSIEAYLPNDEPVLYIRNTIENKLPENKYTYWWSNIAVPETPGTRVIVPADEAIICFYGEGGYKLDKTPVPDRGGIDYSYPKNSKRSQDFFYKIPDNHSKWLAAVENDGKGLIQFSQSRLIGRKLFLWGQGAGGRHWGGFLSKPGSSYIEIQAGLAHTQLEHLPLAAGEKISWIEGYCAADCAPDKIHGTWEDAQTEIEQKISEYADLNNIDASLESKFPEKLKNRKIVYYGSGWGYVEECAGKYTGADSLTDYFTFPADSVTEKEKKWLDIINGGRFPEVSPLTPSDSYMTDPELLEIFEQAAKKSNNWYGYNQLAVAYYANERISDAKKALEKSISLCPSPWAYRNLAMIYKNTEDNVTAAADYMLKAFESGCRERGIIINCAQTLIGDCRYSLWIRMFDELPEQLKTDGRLLFYKAFALLRSGNPRAAADILTPEFVMNDIKEGEVSISHLWFEIYDQLGEADNHPLPFDLDFRMD